MDRQQARLYHFSVQVIGRSRGQSAVAAAAYRAGERLLDQRTGDVHDYSRRRGVVYSEVLLPTGAAPHLRDRERLWHEVERLEVRKDAQLAREINLALPHELNVNARRNAFKLRPGSFRKPRHGGGRCHS